MIIGINGKIGVGKDTVGSIIQYLTAKDTGQFCLGRIQSGKSIEGHHNSKFEIKKFAGKLKQIASLLTGIPVEKFEDQEFKKAYLEEEWGTVRSNPMNAIPIFEDVGFNELMSIREFLQKLGTEAIRDGLHPNAWVNALFADYKAKWVPTGDSVAEEDVSLEKEYPNWIITDMRFPNELEAVEEREGITIRVARPDMQSLQAMVPAHASETALDDAKFDYEIINDGSIDDLIEKVRQILITEKIIL